MPSTATRPREGVIGPSLWSSVRRRSRNDKPPRWGGWAVTVFRGVEPFRLRHRARRAGEGVTSDKLKETALGRPVPAPPSSIASAEFGETADVRDPESLRHLAAKGVAWSAAQTLGSRALSVATFVVLAHLLDPHSFGLVAFASVAIAFLTIFVHQGFGQALVQAPQLEKRHLDTAFWIAIGFGCFLAFVVVGLSWPLARLFHLPEVAPVLRVLALAFVLSGLASTQTAILQRRMAFRSLAIRLTAGNLVGATVGITAALLGAGVWSLVAQTLSSAAVGVVVVWTASRWRPGLSVTRDTYAELFRFSRSVLGQNVAGFFLRRTDDFFIGAVLGPVLLGIYTVAFRLLIVMMDVSINTVQTVALPTFSRLQHDRDRLRKAYFAATRVSAVVALPTFCFIIAAAPEIIHVFFGPRWDLSIPVMRVLSLIGVANTLTNFNGTVLTSVGRPDLALRFLVIASVTNVIGVAIAVHWGILAVATALVLRNVLVGSPLSIHYVKITLGFGYREYFSSYRSPVLGALLVLSAGLLTHVALLDVMGNAGRLVVMLLATAAVYTMAIRVLDQQLMREMMSYVQATLSRKKRVISAV